MTRMEWHSTAASTPSSWERARLDSYKDDGGRGRLADDGNASGCHGEPLNPFLVERMRQGGTDGLLPDGLEDVRTERH